MKLLDALVPACAGVPSNTEERFNLDALAEMIYNGQNYIVGPSGSKADEVAGNFASYIRQIHSRHGVVAAAVGTRALLLSQVRFRWRDETDGTLSSDRELRPLNRPGSRTRTNMLALLEQDVSYSGTAFVAARGGQRFRLAPDKTKFVLGSNSDPQWNGDTLVPPFDTQVIGLLHDPSMGVSGKSGQVEAFLPGEFAVWAPEPDALYPWRGTSWVTSVVRETLLDGQVTDHMGKFFEKAATPGLVFLMDPSKTPDDVKAYAKVVNDKFAGSRNAFKNMFLGGGTDVKVVGSSIKDLGLNELQGTFENRVALRSFVNATVLGTKESLSGSSLNAGNYGAARRLLADRWFTPTVDGLCESLEAVVNVPAGKELGFDRSRVLFLQEDEKDAADIMQTNAVAARQLVEAGYEPTSVIAALKSGDMSKLTHTGNVSVQLQPPGSGTPSKGATG